MKMHRLVINESEDIAENAEIKNHSAKEISELEWI